MENTLKNRRSFYPFKIATLLLFCWLLALPAKSDFSSASDFLLPAENLFQSFSYLPLNTTDGPLNSADNFSNDTGGAASVAPKIIGKLLNYPNPFRRNEGTTIGYWLNGDFNTTLKIYNMLGHELLKQSFYAGESGGKSGLNKIKPDIDFKELAKGVYIYIILQGDKVLAKGKMGIF